RMHAADMLAVGPDLLHLPEIEGLEHPVEARVGLLDLRALVVTHALSITSAVGFGGTPSTWAVLGPRRYHKRNPRTKGPGSGAPLTTTGAGQASDILGIRLSGLSRGTC